MNKLAKVWHIALLTVTLLFAANPVFADDKDPKAAWELIKQGAMVVDVRTPEEFAEGHIEGAINIPFEQINSEFAALGISKDTKVVLYCRSGRRSGIANDALIAAGYNHTYNGGGYQALISTGKQAVKTN
ncbi:rhodanese-like domain-containing protein [Shewanella sp.]|uniref:rhodanese-like domain-containing protein n=1 Tax=Shewanella sp. TaxID=50422 RepID=UPI0035696B18